MADALLNMLDPSLQLNDLRQRRLEEMKHNLSMRSRTFATAATPADEQQLEADINNDPDTGTSAQDAIRKVEQQNADQAAYMSPGATEVRQSKQADKLAEMLAVPKQQGQNALDLEKQREAGDAAKLEQEHAFTRELMSNQGGTGTNEVGGQGYTPSISPTGAVSFRGVPPKRPTTEEQRALDTMQSLSSLGPEMLSKYETQYPGIGEDPTQYSGLWGVLKGAVGGAAYKAGYMNDTNADQLTQLTGYLEAVLPRMLSSGRINREQYTDLKMHVPQVGLSAGANYQRAKYVLDRILPHVRAAIGTPAGAADPYANPDYQPQ